MHVSPLRIRMRVGVVLRGGTYVPCMNGATLVRRAGVPGEQVMGMNLMPGSRLPGDVAPPPPTGAAYR